ncbi:MAG: ABC transporter permease [Thermoplasmata archaeon]
MNSGLLKYIATRAVASIITILGAVILMFILTHLLSPNPAHIWAGPHASAAEIAAITREYHLNQPIQVQLYYYIIDLFTFNFGISPFFKQPVSQLIAIYYPRTLILIAISMVISIIIGIYSGAFAAVNQDKFGDGIVRAAYLITWSTPPFLVALFFQYVLSYYAGWLPSGQLVNPTLGYPPFVTPILPLNAILYGDWGFLSSYIIHSVLPVIALTAISFGIITRITRASMLETLKQDFIRTQIMKGTRINKVIYSHAVKNSLIPVVTVISLLFSFLIVGSLVIEEVFSYTGMGYLVTQALYNYDYPTLIGSIFVIALSVIVINFATDVIYALIDPRIRVGGR